MVPEESPGAGVTNPRLNNLSPLSPYFYAHSIYNFLWGVINILFPSLYFNLIGMEPPRYLAIWQVVGMFVLVYVPAYYWIGQDPKGNEKLVIIAALGTLFGPLGYVFSVLTGQLPIEFGYTLITNDLIWFPLFILYFYYSRVETE